MEQDFSITRDDKGNFHVTNVKKFYFALNEERRDKLESSPRNKKLINFILTAHDSIFWDLQICRGLYFYWTEERRQTQCSLSDYLARYITHSGIVSTFKKIADLNPNLSFQYVDDIYDKLLDHIILD